MSFARDQVYCNNKATEEIRLFCLNIAEFKTWTLQYQYTRVCPSDLLDFLRKQLPSLSDTETKHWQAEIERYYKHWYDLDDLARTFEKVAEGRSSMPEQSNDIYVQHAKKYMELHESLRRGYLLKIHPTRFRKEKNIGPRHPYAFTTRDLVYIFNTSMVWTFGKSSIIYYLHKYTLNEQTSNDLRSILQSFPVQDLERFYASIESDIIPEERDIWKACLFVNGDLESDLGFIFRSRWTTAPLQINRITAYSDLVPFIVEKSQCNAAVNVLISLSPTPGAILDAFNPNLNVIERTFFGNKVSKLMYRFKQTMQLPKITHKSVFAKAGEKWVRERPFRLRLVHLAKVFLPAVPESIKQIRFDLTLKLARLIFG